MRLQTLHLAREADGGLDWSGHVCGVILRECLRLGFRVPYLLAALRAG